MFDEFVVTNVVSIDSENTTEMEELTETEVSPLDGEVEETVGGVVSIEVLSVVVPDSEDAEDSVSSRFPHPPIINVDRRIKR